MLCELEFVINEYFPRAVSQLILCEMEFVSLMRLLSTTLS
jgi:hypothetical protein